VGACSKNNTSVLCATLNASSQHDFCTPPPGLRFL
jgi:hypothetical protein